MSNPSADNINIATPHLKSIPTGMSGIGVSAAAEGEDLAQIQRDVAHTPVRNMGFVALVGVGMVICGSWAAIGSTLVIGLNQGGPVVLVYGMFICGFVYLFTALSLGELGAAYPTAGGQYHWTYLLAPASVRRGASFITGIASMAAWIFLTAASVLLAAFFLLGTVQYRNPSYVIKTWHTFLVYELYALVFTLYNMFVVGRTPWIHQISSAFVIGGAFLMIFSVAFGSGVEHRNASSWVWTGWVNETGWSNSAIVFFGGLVNANFAFAGLDGMIHMSEETPNPRKDIPRGLLSTITVATITGLAFAITCLYSIQDFTEIVTTATGVPLFQIFAQTTGKVPFATFLMVFMILLIFLGNVAAWQTTSRLTWSLAMDNGLYGSKYLSRLNKRYNSPIYATLFDSLFVVLIGVLYVGSTTAYNALVSCSLILSNVTYSLPVIFLMLRKRKLEVKSHFPLHNALGWFANIITILWTIFIAIFYCFPVYVPVQAQTMNYASVSLAFVFILAVIDWLVFGKRHYRGPTITLAPEHSSTLHYSENSEVTEETDAAK